jgi:GNAT superfamily N-acetyltransferase
MDDALAARRLFQNTFAFSEWRNWAEAWRTRNAVGCWVARSHGAILGVSIVSKENVIKYIAVDPDFQGFKIGSNLLKLILLDLADARSIRLVTAGDERLLTWYGRFGFVVTKTVCAADGSFLGAFMTRRNRSRSAKTH